MQKEKKTAVQAKKARQRLKLYIFVFVVGLMLFRGVMQIPRINQKKEEIENLKQEKVYEEARADEVENMKEIVDTEEYIEKIARENLGLVHEDEKIFIDVSKKDN